MIKFVIIIAIGIVVTIAFMLLLNGTREWPVSKKLLENKSGTAMLFFFNFIIIAALIVKRSIGNMSIIFAYIAFVLSLNLISYAQKKKTGGFYRNFCCNNFRAGIFVAVCVIAFGAIGWNIHFYWG